MNKLDKMIAVVFDNDTQAYEASRTLQGLHGEGPLIVYSVAVIEKDASDTVHVRDAVEEGPIGTAIGMSVGTLIGALGGPAGVLAGAAIGSLAGMYADVYNVSVGASLRKASAKSCKTENLPSLPRSMKNGRRPWTVGWKNWAARSFDKHVFRSQTDNGIERS